jgi:hypothetical protein
MQEKLNFTNEDELRAWLEKQPTQWSQVIAWRIAMRVTPVLGRLATVNLPEKLKRNLLFSIYRCLLISSVARNCPTDDIKAAADAATDAAADAADAAADAAYAARTAARAAAYAAAYAARAAAGAAAYAAYAAGAAALAAFAAADAAAVWRAVSADGDFLQKGGDPNALAVQSLWWEASPEEFAQLWSADKQDAPGFAPWQAWWEAATGWGGQTPHDYFGEELSKRIALQPKEWWDRGAAAVNADVVQWLNERGPLIESPAGSVEQDGEPLFPPADHRPHYADDGIERDANGVPVDHLGVRREARIFARLLAGQETKLPLAVGLFGPWGGGKSFFMESICAEMKALAKDKAPGYHHAVAHITFNAWHYVDADLWASLGLRIFEGVTEHLGEGKESDRATERLKLGEAISSNRRIKEDAEAELAAARRARDAAQAELLRKQEERRGVDLSDLLGKDKFGGEIIKLAATVGLATPKDMESLENAVTEARRLAAGWEKFLPGRMLSWPLWVRYSSLVGVAVGGSFIVEQWPAALNWVTAQIGPAGAAVSTFAASAGWLAHRVNKVRDLPDKLEAEVKRLRGMIASAPAAGDLAKLAALDDEIAKLRAAADNAEREIAGAAERLRRADSGMLIYDHLTERVKDARYVDRQGVVAVLRRDLEDLKRYLDNQTREEGKIQRIVLYIDDLDRCEPARVVEVLQAVHLLLAFPLFAVIVAVDPRWLERSLYDKYVPGHLAMAPPELAKVNFTPRNYLEKIFQIPYRLKPMDDAFDGLVDGLTKGLLELPAVAETTRPMETAKPQERPAEDSAGLKKNLDDLATEGAAAPQEPSLPSPPPPPPPPPESKPPEPLTLTDEEVKALKATQPLVPTPRALKRLINIYLLTRLQKPKASESPYDAMILLGLEMGFPVAGKKLLERIRGEGEAGAATLTGLAEKIEAPDADRLTAALQKVGPEVTVKDVYDWLEFAERFSFDPPPAGPA